MATKKHEKTEEFDEFDDDLSAVAPSPPPPKKKTPQEGSAEPAQENRQPLLEIVGEQVLKGKNETRLFQTGPFQKRWMTKAQAEAEKRYWAEED